MGLMGLLNRVEQELETRDGIKDNLNEVAALSSALLRRDFTEEDVATILVANKLSRQTEKITETKPSFQEIRSREIEKACEREELEKRNRVETATLYTFNQYQKDTGVTAYYGAGDKITYPTLGLCGEAGEVADKVKKVIRDKDGIFSDGDRQEIAKELGDCLWYIAAISRDLGIEIEEVAEKNVDKIMSRKERGTRSGSGDNR